MILEQNTALFHYKKAQCDHLKPFTQEGQNENLSMGCGPNVTQKHMK